MPYNLSRRALSIVNILNMSRNGEFDRVPAENGDVAAAAENVLSSQEAADEVEKATWPPLSHNAFVAMVVINSISLAIVIACLGMSGHTYFTSVQRKESYEQLDLNLIIPKLGETGTAKFSDACYSCEVGVTHDKDGFTVTGDTRIWRFKGKLKLTDHARRRLQFPNGAFIGDMATILLRRTDLSDNKAYVQSGQRDGHNIVHFSEDRKLSTWPLTSAQPVSALSVVPTTQSIPTADRETDVCSSKTVVVDGSIYGAYRINNDTYAVCTCAYDSTGKTPTEYCMGLTQLSI